MTLLLFGKFICIIALTSPIYPLLFHPVLCHEAHLYRLYSPAPKPMASDGVSPWEPWQKIHQKDKGERRVMGYFPLDPWLGRSFWWSAWLACSPQLLPMCAPTFQSPPQPHLSLFLGPGVVTVLLLLALGSCTRLCAFPIPHPHSYNESPCK